MGEREVCSRETTMLASGSRHEGNGEASVTMPERRERVWQHRAALPLGLLLLTAVGAGVVWLWLQLAIERCGEAGGKWASLDRRCTFAEPIEPEPMVARPTGSVIQAR
jgi:hypothetical protein